MGRSAPSVSGHFLAGDFGGLGPGGLGFQGYPQVTIPFIRGS